MRPTTYLAIAGLAMILGTLPTVSAQSIPIPNAGFEDPVIPVGGLAGFPSPWFYFSQQLICEFGIAHPMPSQVAPVSDGSQLAFALINTSCPGPGSVGKHIEFTLQLNAVWKEATAYTFSMDFFRAPGIAFPDVAVQLCGLACLPGGAATPGTFTTSTAVKSHQNELLGHPITIRIMIDSPGPMAKVFFDNLRLEAVSTTLPSKRGWFVTSRPDAVVPGQLNAVCSSPIPCHLFLEAHNLQGVLLSQQEFTLRSGQSASLELPGGRGANGAPAAAPNEIAASFVVESGEILASLELVDTDLRTRLFEPWGDGSVSKLGKLDFGSVGLSRSDTGRLKAFCDGSVRTADGSVRKACEVTFEFTDGNGRVLKSSRTTLQPGTGAFVDLHYEDTGGSSPRAAVAPCLKVAGGSAVASFALLDRASGQTITQSSPAALVSAGRTEEHFE